MKFTVVVNHEDPGLLDPRYPIVKPSEGTQIKVMYLFLAEVSISGSYKHIKGHSRRYTSVPYYSSARPRADKTLRRWLNEIFIWLSHNASFPSTRRVLIFSMVCVLNWHIIAAWCLLSIIITISLYLKINPEVDLHVIHSNTWCHI